MRIGIDLGGSKIEGIVLDDTGAELARMRVPTPAGDYAGTVSTIAELVSSLEQHVTTIAGRRAGSMATVGIGIPGTISAANGLVKNANATWLIGRPLDRDLHEALGRAVRVANDANCFAVSEAVDGAAAGARIVFGVILGTGVGGGIVIDGSPLRGVNAIAGEWGHNPLPWPRDGEWPGPSCYCGRTGCIETFLSGPGLARDHRTTTGVDADARKVARLAEAGDAAAVHTMARYQDRLARALASVINVLDPDVIVLGGGLSNLGTLYPVVPALWHPWVFSEQVETRLVRNRHGDSSGVRGAAWLWPAHRRR